MEMWTKPVLSMRPLGTPTLTGTHGAESRSPFKPVPRPKGLYRRGVTAMTMQQRHCPAGTEVCDDLDNDCDGIVDENDATDVLTWYADTDGDGFGDVDVPILACTVPDGYVADATDCDDAVDVKFPGAPEICDTYDNDCDGSIDEAGAFGEPTWYEDGDGDGYGQTASAQTACVAPDGYVADMGDCDDTDAAIHPAAHRGVRWGR